MKAAARNFDDQAQSFDKRAGLPLGVADLIASELVSLGEVGPSDLIFEIGAGTGQIGVSLNGMPVKYHGIDSSAQMLAKFTERCHRIGQTAKITVTDASEPWPVPVTSVKLIFGSRSMHLLPVSHIVQEAFRVLVSPISYLIFGWVERNPNDEAAKLRKKLHSLLVVRDHAPVDAHRHRQELQGAFVRRGALKLAPRVVSHWREQRTMRDMIASWQAVDNLAGSNIERQEKNDLLAELAAWGEEMFGSLDAPLAVDEKYMLAGIKLISKSGGGISQ